MKDTTLCLVSTTPLKPLNRISWNFVVMKDILCRYAFLQEMLIWSFWGAIYIPFLSDCPSLMLGIGIHCIQHSQAKLERGVCELAHSFFHFSGCVQELWSWQRWIYFPWWIQGHCWEFSIHRLFLCPGCWSVCIDLILKFHSSTLTIKFLAPQTILFPRKIFTIHNMFV